VRKVTVLDTTLRDGAQGAGIQFSAQDRRAIALLLDGLGVDYIEAGQSAAHPGDAAFFAAKPALKHAKLAVFGATARKGVPPGEDAGLAALLAADTGTVALFGKSSAAQARIVLRCEPGENLGMIESSVAFLTGRGREIIYDAEHFFDGFREDAAYALETLRAARRGGAALLTLCDTNGGTLPDEIDAAVRRVMTEIGGAVGIHTHNDAGMADANSLAAVLAGAEHVQGTLLGFGERCGNANLATVIAALQIKRSFRCIPDGSLPELTRVCRAVADIANVTIPQNLPYVGENAFTHKAGMHIDAVLKSPATFEHIPPESVGNRSGLTASGLAGRSYLLEQIRLVFPGRVFQKDDPEIVSFMNALKEDEGLSYEAAEASLLLRIRRHFGSYTPAFSLNQMRVISEGTDRIDESSTAILNLRVGGRDTLSAGQGDGPVHALDRALTRALEIFYPDVHQMRLTDYKVRVLNPGEATAARVRVLISSADGASAWSTVGVSENIVHASWQALSDSVEYFLLNRGAIQ
jgi:2-isopropylmalate synthase